MSSIIDDFYDFHKDIVTNTSTGLMAIRDLATYYDVPIDIHFANHWIDINIGSKKTAFQEHKSFYCQDLYERFGELDDIYHWIADAVKRVKGV